MDRSLTWLVDLLPAIAIVVAVLLALSTLAAIRLLRAPAKGPGGRGTDAAGPAPRAELPRTITRSVEYADTRLAALRGSRRGMGSVPLLIAIGAGSAEVQRLIPNRGHDAGDLLRAQRDMFQGDCRISLSPEGAVISFEDGLLASDRRETRWAELIKALCASRGDRPFDGLLIVLPAEQLAGPDRLSDDELMALGDRLYQLIWMAQRTGGWRVPIYLVLNRCQALTGFTAFVEASSQLRSQPQRAPFGWTVPFALDSVFERGWIRQGIDALTMRLSILQTRLMMPPSPPGIAEQLLLFPHAVAAMADPLSILLTPMLRPSAYHEAFMFRGFYLTGRPNDAVAGDTGAATDAFAARLLADRMFPEHVVAQPAQGATTRAQRRIRIAQAVLAVLVVFAVVGVLEVQGQRQAINSVRPLVAEIRSLGDQMQAEQAARRRRPEVATAAGSMPEEQGGTAETQALLKLMSGVRLNHLETPWAPLSYVTDASGEVEAAIRTGYQVAVLRAVGDRLTNNIPALLNLPAPVIAPESITPGRTTCQIAGGGAPGTIDQLQQIVSRIGVYDQNLDIYQNLGNDIAFEDLKSLLEFALSVSMPAGFSTNYSLYHEGLQGAVPPPLDMNRIQRTVATILRTRFAGALDEAYPGSPLGRAVNELVATSQTPGSGASLLQVLKRQHEALHAIQAEAPLQQYAWLGSRVTSVASIGTLLDQLNALSTQQSSADLVPVGPGLPAELRQANADCASRTRTALLDARVFGGIPVLALDQDSAALSPALLPLISTLEGFLAQPLVTATITPSLAPPAEANAPLFWNPQDLQALQTMAESYLVFAAQNLPQTLPASFREQVQAAAGERIETLIDNAVARAQQRGADRGGASGGTAALRDEIGRFADVAPILTNLREPLREAGRTAAAERLDDLLSAQAIRLLGQVDALLTAADPYQLVDRGLSFWSGTPPLAAAAFGAGSLPELVGTLPARRDYVEALAHDYAAPLAAYLQQSGALLTGPGAVLLNRWQSILTTLDRYHRGDPANSLSRLEQFISADMDRIDLANCSQFAAAANGGSDWFAEQLAKIRGAVVNRCGGAAYGDAVSEYGDLSEAFNHDLAGRFPFGAPSAPDADPGDVKRFYNRFGADLPALRERLAAIQSYARAGAPQFVDRLIAVQTALAPMLADPAPDAALTYSVNVEFRTNIGSDPGANQIAEAVLQFGQQKLSSFAASKTMAWTNGQPAQMTLRWATNAPTIPAGGSEAAQDVPGPAVVFRYGGAWALLRMIAAQGPDPALMAQLSDRRPETIGFTVKLIPNPDAAAGGNPGLTQAQVFMRLGLSATVRTPNQPDKVQAVALPIFPTAAPGSVAARPPIRSAGKPIALHP